MKISFLQLREKLKTFPLLILTLAFVTLAYSKVFSSFFAQDEWLSFSLRFLLQKKDFLDQTREIFAPSVGHFQPLNTLALQTLFNFFQLNYLSYAIVSVCLHLIIVLLVFYLTKAILDDNKVIFLTALLFGVLASSFQATSWVLADTSIHFSTIFSYASILLLFKFFKNKKAKFFIFSIISLLVSLLFKEISIGLFILLPLLFLLFSEMPLVKSRKYISVILIVGLIYGLFRVGMIYLPQAYSHDTLVIKSQPLEHLAYNLVTFPFKGVSQSIIPSKVLLQFSYFIGDFLPSLSTKIKNTPNDDKFVQEEILEVVSFTFSVAIIFLSIFLWQKNKSNIWGKTIIFSLIFIMINSPIFAFSPEKTGRVFILDSRNLYLLSLGTSLLTVSIIKVLAKNSFLKTLLIILIFIFANTFWLNSYLSDIAEIGSLRKNVLTTVYQNYPKLPKEVIFYTESDSSFYGIPQEERILPFQSGFGQTLLVWYSQTKRFPEEFFQNKFLWGITDQGYKEAEDQGFGYFRDFKLLAQTVKEKNILPASVISFRYSSRDQVLTHNAQEVRGRLAGYLADKKEIDPRLFIITPSINMEDISLMFDKKRETFWNSEVPYATSQTIDIDLRDSRKIAQVRIDSYNNKDQNEVGYEVSTSQDGKDWRTVFYAKRYPPGDDGYVDLFFEPQPTRFIRISQIGFHQYATWVIHEMRVYETIN